MFKPVCCHDRITNKEVLEMADMGNLSEDVRRTKWKFIGHRGGKDMTKTVGLQ